MRSLSFLFVILSFTPNTKTIATNTSSDDEPSSALTRARSLNAPHPTTTSKGDLEDHSFWHEHETLLQDAISEYGPLHEELYEYNQEFQDAFVNPVLMKAIRHKNLGQLSSIVQETDAPGVFVVPIFTREFTTKIIKELNHYEASGIPIRRPNSMNRHGMILSQIGFENLLKKLSSNIFQPLARLLFSEFVSSLDLMEHYSFIVRYKPGMDRNLTSHTDHSSITFNVCLENTMDEKVLYFNKRVHSNVDQRIARDQPTLVSLSSPGLALIHLGQHEHGVLRVHGERTQMVLWMYGKDGYVRVAPYENHEILPHEWEVSENPWMSKHREL